MLTNRAKAVLSSKWWRASADSPGQPTRGKRRGRRYAIARSGKCDAFKTDNGGRRQRRVPLPATARCEVVANRFRGSITRVVGSASIARKAQRVLVVRARKIAGPVIETERAGTVQGWYRDLEQQSDRGKHSTETAAGSVGDSEMLLSPQPYRHIERPNRRGGA